MAIKTDLNNRMPLTKSFTNVMRASVTLLFVRRMFLYFVRPRNNAGTQRVDTKIPTTPAHPPSHHANPRHCGNAATTGQINIKFAIANSTLSVSEFIKLIVSPSVHVTLVSEVFISSSSLGGMKYFLTVPNIPFEFVDNDFSTGLLA